MKRSSLISTKLISSLLPAALALTACGKDPVSVPNGVEVNNDEASLQNRITPVNTPVETVPVEGQGTQLTGLLSDVLSLVLTAEIAPPTVGSISSAGQANHIVLNGTNMAVGYNVAGDTQAGAVDVFSIGLLGMPKLVSEVKFETKDVNGVFLGKTAVYTVGADSANGGASFLNRIPLDSALKMSSTITEVPLTGYAGTSVYSSGTTVYATSGDNGELATFDPITLAKKSGVSLFDARAVGYSSNSGNIFAFSGRPGTLHTFSKAGALSGSKVVGGASIAQSKSTIQVGDSMSLISQGAEGFSIVCNATGEVMAAQAAVTVAGKDPAKTVTNGASMLKNLVFVANGEAGVYVYRATVGNVFADSKTCQKITLTLIGSLALGEFSANAVKFNSGNLVVATGSGGLKLIAYTALSLLPSILGGENNEVEQ